MIAGAMSTSHADPRSLRVMTFNLRCDVPSDGAQAWPNRRAFVREALHDAACDIIGFQEVLPHQLDHLISDLPGYAFISRSREIHPGEGEALPIFCRSDRVTIDPIDHGTFWLSEMPDKAGSKSWDSCLPRVATWARVVCKATGQGVYVYNVHLDHQGEIARRAGIGVVVAHMRSRRCMNDPVIVMGDFNAEPGSAPIEALRSAGLVDVSERAGDVDVGSGRTFHGWTGEPGESCIDLVLASPLLRATAVRTLRARRGGVWLSDHFPLMADFTREA